VLETDRDIPDRVVAYYEGFAYHQPILRRDLRAGERIDLLRRREELLIAVGEPITKRHWDRCAGAVSSMFRGFPTMARLNRESAVATVGVFLQEMRNYPPWAVIKACDLVRTGKADLNRTYCPTDPEFHEVVRGLIAPYELQLRKTDAVLDASLPSAQPKPNRTIAEPRRQAVETDGEHGKRVKADLAIRKLRREIETAPTVFDLDPADWNT
jgi:hypothetical protein